MFVAVDLGASSGRVIQGRVVDGEVELTEVHRFATGPRPRPDGGLRWHVKEIYWHVLSGLKLADGPVSVGVDSWAIDYGLIGPDGKLDGDVRLADHTMLLLPDLITYWLTGTMGAEVTNASTTGLLDATTRQWSPRSWKARASPGRSCRR